MLLSLSMSLSLLSSSSRPSPRPWLLLLRMLLRRLPPWPLLLLPRQPWTPSSTPTRRRRLLSPSCCPGNNHRVLCERMVRSYRIGVVGVVAVARLTTPLQPTPRAPSGVVVVVAVVPSSSRVAGCWSPVLLLLVVVLVFLLGAAGFPHTLSFRPSSSCTVCTGTGKGTDGHTPLDKVTDWWVAQSVARSVAQIVEPNKPVTVRSPKALDVGPAKASERRRASI